MRKEKNIDRKTHEPAYMQIVRIMSEKISRGIFKPDDQLPPESKICADYKVSPMTVRRAVNILVDKGIVSTIQGKGTFVNRLNIGEAVFRLKELRNRWSQNNTATVKLLDAGILWTDEDIAEKLGIGAGQRAIQIKRLLMQEGIPTIYHQEYVIYDPRRPLVEAQLQITSLEGLLQGDTGEGFKRGDLTIEAMNLAADEAALLQVPTGTAAFCLKHVFYDFNDHPVSYGWFICRADYFNLTTHIGINADS
jgi:DNA-binding GntR family transcriptional regulator